MPAGSPGGIRWITWRSSSATRLKSSRTPQAGCPGIIATPSPRSNNCHPTEQPHIPWVITLRAAAWREDFEFTHAPEKTQLIEQQGVALSLISRPLRLAPDITQAILAG